MVKLITMKIKWSPKPRIYTNIHRSNVRLGMKINCTKDLVMTSGRIEAFNGKSYEIHDFSNESFYFIDESGDNHSIEFIRNEWFKLRI